VGVDATSVRLRMNSAREVLSIERLISSLRHFPTPFGEIITRTCWRRPRGAIASLLSENSSKDLTVGHSPTQWSSRAPTLLVLVKLQSCFSKIIIERYRAMDTPDFMRCLLVRLEINLGDGLPEVLALGLGNIKLELGRSARAVGTSKRTSPPRRS